MSIDLGAERRSDLVLEVEDLTTTYHSHGNAFEAVRQVSFDLVRGRRYGLVGESGSGKSSLIRALLGLVRIPNQVTATTLRFDGRIDLLTTPAKQMRQIRGAEIGYVGQNPFGALHPVLSVGEQYHQFLKAHGQSRRRRDSLARAAEVLAGLGLPDPPAVLKGHAGQLSGGMAQRVVLGFSTLLQPQFIIADEPTTALDVTVQRQVLDLLAEETSGGKRSLLLVTHDLSVVAQYCDDVLVMRKGRIVETGPVRQVFAAPHHPYTAALLASVPRPGTPPRPMTRTGAATTGTGCEFAPLCPLAQENCLVDRPLLLSSTPGRRAACHHMPPQREAPRPVSAAAGPGRRD
jgi:oligopeptide/dipeptide ABC transporter ATP-binding protein